MSKLHQSVLLSGGMDSVAALHWAKKNSRSCRAIGFAYGQPNRDNELTIAGHICAGLGVPFAMIALAETLHTGAGLMRGIVDHDQTKPGLTSPAFLPGRNAVFLTVAAAHACSWFKVGTIDLVVGATRDDQDGFPDCTQRFFDLMSTTIKHGYEREIRIHAPWVAMPKSEVCITASDAARYDITRSWSCYRSDGPCGKCSPCVLRSHAFRAAGLVDTSAPATMFGGDPGRSAR